MSGANPAIQPDTLRRQTVEPPAHYDMARHVQDFCRCGAYGVFGFHNRRTGERMFTCAEHKAEGERVLRS